MISLFWLTTAAKMMPYKKMGEDSLITKDPETPKGQTAIPATVMVVPGSQTTNPVSDPSIMKRFPHNWPFATGTHLLLVVPFTKGQYCVLSRSNCLTNNRYASDLIHPNAHVMSTQGTLLAILCGKPAMDSFAAQGDINVGLGDFNLL